MLSSPEVASFFNIASLGKSLLYPQINTAFVAASGDQSRLSIAPMSTRFVEAGRNAEFTPSKDPDFDPLIDYSYSDNMRSTEIGQGGLERLNDDADNGSQRHCQIPAKRKAPPLQRAVAKRKTTNGNDSLTRDDVLAKFLCEEDVRCKNHGCPPPHESFFTPAVRAAIRDLCEAEADTLARISVYIASPYLIAVLQGILQKSREHHILPATHVAIQLSRAARFNLIRTLDKHITYFQLLRRYHILELFKDCGGPVTPSGSGFVLTTESNFEKSRRRPGNPMNLAEAEVTTRMMEEVCPDIGSDSDGYQAMYRIATDLRKLGQRLYVLETTFAGRGILGLMLDTGVTGQLGVGISDNM
jgi:hypothetical protein